MSDLLLAAARALNAEAEHLLACLLSGREYRLPAERHRPTAFLPVEDPTQGEQCRECGEPWPCAWRRSYEQNRKT